jgi:hypothetical protein
VRLIGPIRPFWQAKTVLVTWLCSTTQSPWITTCTHPPTGRAEGFYIYDKKDIFSAWVGFSFVFNSARRKGIINFAGADGPLLQKTRDISVIGGTGDFFMARVVATLMTDAFENQVYFRLCVDVKLYECWSRVMLGTSPSCFILMFF